MGLLGVCNAYTMRVCLNLAITQMVNRNKTDGTHFIDPNACPDDEVVGNITSSILEKPVSEFTSTLLAGIARQRRRSFDSIPARQTFNKTLGNKTSKYNPAPRK